jgi:RimJ/RimL family protein N-acetyltransferase
MQPRREYTLAIILRATNVVIGACTLMIQRQQVWQGELGYFLHPGFWGHGYATEVAQHLLQFGFITLRLQRIVATCDPRNIASVRVLEKVGMHYEGRLHKHMLLRDGWRDSLVYSIHDHEWMAAKHEHDPG